MSLDVVDIRDFYATSLGIAARRMVRRQLRALWPDVSGMNVLGFGYATPYLHTFMDEADRVCAVMPNRMGVLPWPSRAVGEQNLAMVAREDEIPLPDLSVNRILMVHGLESTENARLLLREMWRVLSDGGRLMVVVPNRRSIWARADHTPFGHGHPYSMEQLNRALRQSLFTPVHEHRALFFPPSRRRFWLTAAPAWERLGERWFSPLGGVVIVEATKQIYGGQEAGQKQRRRAYAPAPSGQVARVPISE
ncbi:MAG: methyltransferase domain-containing protein [Alphaproteobacteria bacterium]|jgi:SAM-dependent methyltransferase|nr:methyltransferase domain-containing protein [Alphaproteobacteria bacterium]